MEETHIERDPQGEIEEIRQIFKNKGFSEDLLEQIVNQITSNRKRWVDTMLVEEFGLQLNPISPLKAALSVFVAFCLVGAVPLIPLIFFAGALQQSTFYWSLGFAGFAFLVVGAIRGKIMKRSPLVASFETLVMGSVASGLAYLVGKLVEGMVDIPF